MTPPPIMTPKILPTLFLQRIQREMKDIFESDFNNCGYKLELADGNDYTCLVGEIFGPVGSPYESGRFSLSVKIPTEYPFRPPEVKFQTRIWHPNVSSVTGAICLDILKDQWTAALNIRTVMISVQALLSEPVPDDPQDGVVAGQYLRSKEMFDKTAQYWTHVFANGEKVNEDLKKKETELVSLGFSVERVRVCLSQSDWDVDRATSALLDP